MKRKIKFCHGCSETKSSEVFYKNKYNKDNLDTYCQGCRKERSSKFRKDRPEYVYSSKLKALYGITAKQREEMQAAQNNKCAICLKAETAARAGKVKALAVDHNKSTGKVRALLCQKCNHSLGLLNESFDSVLRMAKYIQHHNGVV